MKNKCQGKLIHYLFLLFLLLQTLIKNIQMASRSKWTEEEDQELRKAVFSQQNRNWVKISRSLNTIFRGKERTSKQCRERFINHCSLEPGSVAYGDWPEEQNKRLIELFENIGPRWIIMAPSFPGRTENNIKNKFYSWLRKFVRKLNTITKRFLIRYKKQLKYDSVLRVLEASRSLFLSNEALVQSSQEVRHEVLNLMAINLEGVSDEDVAKLVQKINKFNLQTRSFRLKKIYRIATNEENQFKVVQKQIPSEKEKKYGQASNKIEAIPEFQNKVTQVKQKLQIWQHAENSSSSFQCCEEGAIDKDRQVDLLSLFSQAEEQSKLFPQMSDLEVLRYRLDDPDN